MTLHESRKGKEPGKDLRSIGLLTAVPGLLLAAPLIGMGIGWYLDKKLGTDPYLMVVGVLMGIASGGIETYRLIKKASALEKDDDDER